MLSSQVERPRDRCDRPAAQQLGLASCGGVRPQAASVSARNPSCLTAARLVLGIVAGAEQN
jgi:hypothetical protein